MPTAQPQASLRPTCEGQIVHYVLKEGRSAGRTRAAMIVNSHGGNRTQLNLHVFLDGANDEGNEFSEGRGHVACIGQAYSAPYSEANEPGSWHWPSVLRPPDSPPAPPGRRVG